jgi:hypothetical protein
LVGSFFQGLGFKPGLTDSQNNKTIATKKTAFRRSIIPPFSFEETDRHDKNDLLG